MNQLTQKDVAEILARKGEKRYKYFLRTVLEEEEVWGLADEEGWLMLEESEEADSDIFAVWPKAEFAEVFRKEAGFEEFQVEAMDLSEFLAWLDDFEEKKMKVAVFPRPDFESAVMTPSRLKEDFKAEFGKEAGE